MGIKHEFHVHVVIYHSCTKKTQNLSYTFFVGLQHVSVKHEKDARLMLALTSTYWIMHTCVEYLLKSMNSTCTYEELKSM